MSTTRKPDFVQLARDAKPTLRERNAKCDDGPRRSRGDDSRVQGRRLLPNDAAEALGRIRVPPDGVLRRSHRGRLGVPVDRVGARRRRGAQLAARPLPGAGAEGTCGRARTGSTHSPRLPTCLSARSRKTSTAAIASSGKWGFSSGCDHCQWTFLGAYAPKEEGRPQDMFTMLLPRSDYELVDDWFVSGLKGTGSKSVLVDDAFVPEHRVHRMSDAFQMRSPGKRGEHGAALPSALRAIVHAHGRHAGHRNAAGRARSLRQSEQEPHGPRRRKEGLRRPLQPRDLRARDARDARGAGADEATTGPR